MRRGTARPAQGSAERAGARPSPGQIGGVVGAVRALGADRIEESRPRTRPVPQPPSPDTGWAMLACPHCVEPAPLGRADRRLVCHSGHVFDLARQGYVSLLSGRGRHGLAADDARMVANRAEVQGSGLYAPIRDGVVEAVAHAASDGLPAGGLVDVGGGTGYYAASVLDAASRTGTPTYGVGFDLSAYAARRAAKAHPDLVSVVADVRERFPLLDHSASVALVVFAPRDGAELARVLAPGGVAVVVTPLPNHLAELSGLVGTGMLSVDPLKDDRLAQQFAAFDLVSEREVEAAVPMTTHPARAVAAMGPSAHHLPADPADDEPEVALGGAADETHDVTLAVRIATYRPRS